MPYLHNHKLFASHAWRYSRAITFLDAASNFKYSNFSVPEDDAFEDLNEDQLPEQLRKQIRPVQCVIIISGIYVNHSDWIQFEIDVEKALGKPILGIRRRGEQRTPQRVIDCAGEMVGCNTASIVDAIRRLTR